MCRNAFTRIPFKPLSAFMLANDNINDLTTPFFRHGPVTMQHFTMGMMDARDFLEEAGMHADAKRLHAPIRDSRAVDDAYRNLQECAHYRQQLGA